jgi:hypothetical protein
MAGERASEFETGVFMQLERALAADLLASARTSCLWINRFRLTQARLRESQLLSGSSD